MRLIITADIHHGIQGKLTDTIWSMDIINSYAKKHNINTVLVLGDLFHNRDSINIEVLNKVYESFKKYQEQEWIIFPGNHDMFLKDSWKILSLKPLENVIKIIDTITNITLDSRKFWVLPFIHYEDQYMKELKEIEKQYQPGDVLLTHIGVKGATLNECFLLKNWSVVDFKDSKFDTVFSGHFHCHQKVGKITYPGSPISFRFDEGLVDHGFLTYDTNTGDIEFIKTYDVCSEFSDYHAPDYVTVTDVNLPNVQLEGNNVKVVLGKDYTTNELARIKTILLEKKKAIKVLWTKPEKEIEQLENTGQISSTEDLFQKWVEHDDPKELDKELLQNLHKEIKTDAEERAVNAGDDDGQA